MTREATKLRLNRMINETVDINDETRAAAKRDFIHVAEEYFDTDGVDFSLKKGKSGLEVSVSFHARRVKNFNAVR